MKPTETKKTRVTNTGPADYATSPDCGAKDDSTAPTSARKSPGKKAIFDIVREAFATESLVDFVRFLRNADLEFSIRGSNPRIRHKLDSNAYRFRTAGLLPGFVESLSRWDGYPYRVDCTRRDGWVLTVRLLWIEGCEYASDVPDGSIRSLIHFLMNLGLEEVCDAMTIAQRKITGDDLDGRFRYFCGICHSKIRNLQGGAPPALSPPARMRS
ncbi:MAG: hypothetical protein KDN05_04340 [Verrucomicrobiae bacterium]|nr:hypothetical protein [Verrucomicrobiae bacterium]